MGKDWGWNSGEGGVEHVRGKGEGDCRWRNIRWREGREGLGRGKGREEEGAEFGKGMG